MTNGRNSNRLRLVRAHIDTSQQPVVFMHRDCGVCRAEGFSAMARVLVRAGRRQVVATLNVVFDERFGHDVAALSEAAWNALDPEPEAMGSFSHAEPPGSSGALRAKVFGQRLDEAQFQHLMRDAVDNRLSDVELAAFVTACAGDRLDIAETIALTRAMVAVGERIEWDSGPVYDKHCVGGLPGNRTTPIVVALVAAAGYRMPKTSSRAITSPAGSADTMETMTTVALDLAAMRRVVEREGGCLVWGGTVCLSPADDVLIRVEKPLDFDSDGQLVASVLSKKVAAGSTHVLIDMPIGPTAKVRSAAAADLLEARLLATARAVGLEARVLRTDGTQPVGQGIGPALEARDVLRVLRGDPLAPLDLRERALDLAGHLLALASGIALTQARARARELLDDGSALRKFMAICQAQGGFREPLLADCRHPVLAHREGRVLAIDNRRLARVAKLAGAPGSPEAGVDLRRRLGQAVHAGELLFEINAHTEGELQYALDYTLAHPSIVAVGDSP